MGSKGQSQTAQTQTYGPSPAAYGAITGALGAAQNAASAPFQQPVAPVAGFSPDQYNAFNTVNNAQGMAMPYINSAANLFGQSAQGPNISQFFNPFAGAVNSNLQDIFGQQMSQVTGGLTQQAGGVGADRIAVGQSELAKQQGLTAGQTFANLYAPSLSAAQQEQNILQGAGYGIGVLGPAAQNSVLQGAQAQLGTGGLQQQLAQAQMNAPYQNTLARLAYPFQTAQFLGNMTGALAPGLGGTTAGTGTNTPAQPSIYSQIGGLGLAGAGLYGYGNQQGWWNNLGGGGGGQTVNTAAADAVDPTGGNQMAAQGGRIGYDNGGSLPDTTAADLALMSTPTQGGQVQTDPYLRMQELAQLRGDAMSQTSGNPYALATGVNDKPVDIEPQSVVPSGQVTAIHPNIPQLPQQQSQSGGGGNLFSTLGGIAGSIFLPGAGGAIGGGIGKALDVGTGVNRGGRIHNFDGANPYAFNAGGATFGDIASAGLRLARTYMDGGKLPLSSNIEDRRHEHRRLPPSGGFKSPWHPDGEPIRRSQWIPAADESAMDANARTDPATIPGFDDGGSVSDLDNPYSDYNRSLIGKPPVKDATDINLNAGSGGYGADQPWSNTNAAIQNDVPGGNAPHTRPQITVHPLSSPADSGARPTASATPPPSAAPYVNPYMPQHTDHGFADSPWAALTAAGLGMMGGTSPWAGVNIGQGAMMGLKTLEGQRAAAQKQQTIEQEAGKLNEQVAYHQAELEKPFITGYDENMLPKYGVRDPQHPGEYLDPLTRKPLGSDMPPTGEDRPQGDAVLSAHPDLAGTIKAVAEGRENLSTIPMKQRYLVQKLVHDYDSNWDQGVWNERNRMWGDLSTNGNAGKMILAVNQLLPHLNKASKDAEELNNTGYPAANTIANWWINQTGDPRVTKFEQVREVAAMDAARLLRGSGQMAEKDIEFWRQTLHASGSPRQLQESLDQLADDLIGARIDSIKHSFRTAMNREPPEFVSPEAKAARDQIKTRLQPHQSDADKQALQWANEHPDDPRAAKIKQRLGQQ